MPSSIQCPVCGADVPITSAPGVKPLRCPQCGTSVRIEAVLDPEERIAAGTRNEEETLPAEASRVLGASRSVRKQKAARSFFRNEIVVAVSLFLVVNCLGLVGWGVRLLITRALRPDPQAVDGLSRDLADLAALDAGQRRKAAEQLALGNPASPRRAEVALALEQQLTDSDRPAREAAARALIVWATPANIPALVSAVGDPSEPVRRSAARALTGIGPAVEPAVIPLLFRDDNAARQEAIRILANLGTKDAAIMPAALQSLGEPAEIRRRYAAEWLAKAVPDDALRQEVSHALIASLRDPDASVAGPAARAAAVWGTEENVPDLIQLIEHPDRGVRRSAMAALGAIKDARAVAPLAEKLKSALEWQSAFAAIQAMGNRAEPALVKLLGHPNARVRDNVGKLLKLLDNSANQGLIAALADFNSDDAARRRTGAELLARVPVDESRRAEVARGLEGRLKDPDQRLRESCMKALVVRADADSVPVLIDSLDASSSSVRHNAMRALARLKDARAAEPLARHLPGEPAEAGRTLLALGAAAEPAVVKCLTSSEKRARLEACKILREVGTAASLAPLEEVAGDKDRDLARAAGDAVRAINGRVGKP
jgi:HEAT repeat protein